MEGGQQNEQNFPLLESLEHYIETYGIPPHVNSENSNPSADQLANDAEQRIRDERSYQESIHRKFFDTNETKIDEVSEREKFIDTLNDVFVSMKTSDLSHGEGQVDVIRNLPLRPLAEKCDTIYTLAHARFHADHTSFQKEGKSISEEQAWEISFEEFDKTSMRHFLSVLLPEEGKMPPSDEETGEKEKGNEEKETDSNAISILISSKIPDDQIVECTRIAHFLQCPTVFDALVQIMEASIDSTNCMSICDLSHKLDVPSLFEKSLSFILTSLDDILKHDDEKNEYWVEMTPDLRNHILTLQNAIRSSILSKGHKGGKVFFSSSDEFLAIFQENIQYKKERLHEAKKRQEEMVLEASPHGAGSSNDPIQYAAERIAIQEERIKTLECYYKEQKAIFGKGGSAAGSEKMGEKNNRNKGFVL